MMVWRDAKLQDTRLRVGEVPLEGVATQKSAPAKEDQVGLGVACASSPPPSARPSASTTA